MKKYYLHNEQKQTGPFAIEELKEQKITSDTFVWCYTFTSWTKAGQLDELKGLCSSNPPQSIKESADFEAKVAAMKPPIFIKPNIIIPPTKKSKAGWLFGIVAVLVLLVGYLFYPSFKTKKVSLQENEIAVNANDKLQKQSIKGADETKTNDSILQSGSASITEKNRNYRNNWQSYINVKGNYSSNQFGGIDDVMITVHNDTEYPLNEVGVELQYIKTNHKIFKNEKVTILDIPAHSYKTIAAPKSRRGTRLENRIVSIKSQPLQFCYTLSGVGTTGQKDPWLCK